VLVQGSAIGYYGPRGDEELNEFVSAGDDFMAQVCKSWEAAAQPAEGLGLRLATLRTGVVLARGEGALGVMATVFRAGGASPIGNGGSFYRPADGRQWVSWIHVEDIVGLFLMALDRDDAKGPINGTAPNPVRNADFSWALTRAIRRGGWPRFIPWGPPDLLLNLVLGEVAQAITTGQRAVPARAQSLKYPFQFPDLAGALADLYSRKAESPAPKPEPVEVGAKS
jgi:uncharacterized protein